MTTRGPSKYVPYAVAVIDALAKKPRLREDLQRVCNRVANTEGHSKVPDAFDVIYWIRGLVGGHVISCDRSTNLYSLATSRSEARSWIIDRKKNIRNQTVRTLKAVDDTLQNWGPDQDLGMVQAGLKGVLLILDASPGGSTSTP